MSADRDTIARINNVPVEQVKCRYCGYLEEVSLCTAWDQNTAGTSFCSLWKEKEDTNDLGRVCEAKAPND